ncbi:MAG: carboxypeptidase-like regulatory domain-containing protein [Paludibacteraceae bacterium]|nr:carboxypeptidase-like regulatory domain-containing protein [Paludibacteraceae bacterium]
MSRLHHIIIFFLLSFSEAVFYLSSAANYFGRVVDEHGAPVCNATVYMADDPVIGTATANNGLFHLTTDLPVFSELIVSFIGYEKQTLLLSELHDDTTTIVLREQPINLEEVVIAAKPQKQKNKRKRMQELLAAVYQQMLTDFPTTTTGYHIVSDVRMDADHEPWGMEQMIAQVVVLPRQGHIVKDQRTGKRSTLPTDSIQFSGKHCKRFFDASIRTLADSIYAGNDLEAIHPQMRRAATAIDSGVVVHKSLWSMGNIVFDFANTMNDINHWEVSNESEGETVLTYSEKQNIMGIFVYRMKRHYILHSDDLSVSRFVEKAHIELNIPFGHKVKPHEMQMLNLLNMGEKQIEQYRIRKVHADISFNTIYQERGDHHYPLEKNLKADATIIGKRKDRKPSGRGMVESKDTISLKIRATQRVTTLQTRDVQPLTPKQMTKRLPRTIVPIYSN